MRGSEVYIETETRVMRTMTNIERYDMNNRRREECVKRDICEHLNISFNFSRSSMLDRPINYSMLIVDNLNWRVNSAFQYSKSSFLLIAHSTVNFMIKTIEIAKKNCYSKIHLCSYMLINFNLDFYFLFFFHPKMTFSSVNVLNFPSIPPVFPFSFTVFRVSTSSTYNS